MTLDEIRSAFIGAGVTVPIGIGAIDEKKKDSIFIPTQVPQGNLTLSGPSSYEVSTVQVVYRGTENIKITEAEAVAKLPQTPVTVMVGVKRYRITPVTSGFVSLGVQAGAYELVKYYEVIKN